MAVYIANDTDLTSVADAIRTKAKTTAPLTFPNGFVNAINNLSGGFGNTNVKYIIPASYVPVRTSDDMGFDTTTFTFTRENVNQLFRVDWKLQDEIVFNQGGYWIDSIRWLMYEVGNYESQHTISIEVAGAGKKGNMAPANKVVNYPKTALTSNISVGNLSTTNAGYERWGQNYKGLILIYDSSYNGEPILDASKLTQFFSNCNGQLTAGW